MQMELEGTGVRASIVRPGPTWSEMGTDWDDEAAAVRTQRLGAVRPGPAPALHEARRPSPTRSPPIVSAPRGVHLNLVEVGPEAPVEDR